MKRDMLLLAASAVTLAVARPALAQDHAPADDPPRTTRARQSASAQPADLRAFLGVTLGYSGGERDTLGALVSGVVPDGPAERAGIDAGNRIAAVNAVSLRIDPESIGENGAGESSIRRAARALSLLAPGDEVELRVFSGGRFRTVIARMAVFARSAPTPTAPPVTAPEDDARPAVSAAPVPAAAPVSLASAVDGIAAVQAQLRKLEQNEGAGPALDSLTALEEDLGAIRRRLRGLQLSGDRASSRAKTSDDALPGLSVSTVADELVPVLGEGSEGGLLVLKADDSWDPIRPGDVILRVNDAPATIERLRAAPASTLASTIDVLRRKREISLVLDPGAR